jgi:hypothetical protein
MHADWLNELSESVLRCAFTMRNTGFREKVYENASAHELRKAGLGIVQQRGLTVTYDGVVAAVLIMARRTSRSITRWRFGALRCQRRRSGERHSGE